MENVLLSPSVLNLYQYFFPSARLQFLEISFYSFHEVKFPWVLSYSVFLARAQIKWNEHKMMIEKVINRTLFSRSARVVSKL